MSLNFTPLLEDLLTPILLPTEKIMSEYPQVDLIYESGDGFPGTGANYNVPSGILYFTTHRFIFISVPFQLAFHSLEIRLKHIQNPRLVQPWFGRSYLEIDVRPIPNGGLPIPGIAKFFFKLTTPSLVRSVLVRLLEQNATLEVMENIQGEEPLPMYPGASG